MTKIASRQYRWRGGPIHSVRTDDAKLTTCGAYISDFPDRGTWYVREAREHEWKYGDRHYCQRCFKNGTPTQTQEVN